MRPGSARTAVAVVAAAALLAAGCDGGASGAGPSRSSAVGSGSAGTSTGSTSTGGTSTGGTSTGGPSAGPPGSVTPGAATDADWPMYHHDAQRSGLAASGPVAAHLAVAWRAHLDGAVYGQPLLVRGSLIVATENDTVYALDPSTGHTRWATHVGTPVPLSALPCGGIDPLGITGTPAYDAATGLVFAVAETTGYHHVLVGVDAVTGRVRLRRDLPTPDGQPRFDQQRPALLVVHRRVYVAFGGLEGDCGPYVGSVVGAPTSGSGALVHWSVPTRREGGIWGTGGPTLTADGSTIVVSVGNGAARTAGAGYDGSDAVVALDPSLRRVGFFAPPQWADDNANDLDLGSMAPAVLPHGRIVIAGKRGVAYLLDAAHLGGIGGQLDSRPVCRAFGGPAHAGTVAYLPCRGGGVAAVDTASGHLAVTWRGPDDGDGSPVLTGDTVWVPGWHSGVLYALNRRTGQVRGQVRVADSLPHFASPTVSGGRAYLGTYDGVVAVAAG